jgi:uncharacterized protein (TIGR02246 family)
MFLDPASGGEQDRAHTEEDEMKHVISGLVAPAIAAGCSVAAQQKDAELDRLVQQYVAAWNKADVKALVALYADNPMRTGPTNEVVVGKPALQKYYEAGFATTAKGTTLSVTQGRTQNVTPDLRLQEGTWQVSGGEGGPQRGRYLNTLVRVGGAWRIASVAAIPDTPPAK